jgi:23S rRNA (pseudouridine1915-N3)-methyltransferase
MFRIEILAVGKLKKGPFHELQQDYAGRLNWPVTIHEIESRVTDPRRQQDEENQAILDRLDNRSFVIALDERGDGLRSLDFSQTLQKLRDNGEDRLSFLIGGAGGFTDAVRNRANILLSFGQQTWPHMMVRVMLLEQVYRAQQIMSGHPYHREG